MSKLYVHENHPHQPRNANDLHKEEQQAAGLNAHVAVVLTRLVGTMPTAYIFTVLAVVGLLGLLGWLNPFVFLLAAWLSQQFLQLVFLPILAVGENVLGRHSELMAEEQYSTTMKSYHQLGQIVKHLNAQDEELLRQQAELLKQTKILIALQKRAMGD